MTDTTPVMDADLDSQFALKREVLELRKLVDRNYHQQEQRLNVQREALAEIRSAFQNSEVDRAIAGHPSDHIEAAIEKQTKAQQHMLGHIYDQTKEQVPLLLRLDGRLDNANKQLAELPDWLKLIHEAVASVALIHDDVHLMREAKRPEPAPWVFIIFALCLIVALLCGILVLLAMNFAGATVPDWTWASPPSQRL